MDRQLKLAGIAAVTVVTLTLIYLGYDLIRRWIVPCSDITQPGDIGVVALLQNDKSRLEMNIGPKRVDHLDGVVQLAAVKLLTCCTLVMQGRETASACREQRHVLEEVKERIESDLKRLEFARANHDSREEHIALQSIENTTSDLAKAVHRTQGSVGSEDVPGKDTAAGALRTPQEAPDQAEARSDDRDGTGHQAHQAARAEPRRKFEAKPPWLALNTITAAPGQTVTVEAELSLGELSAATFQADLVFDTPISAMRRDDGKPDCAAYPALRKPIHHDCVNSADCRRVRVIALSFEDVNLISQRTHAFSCILKISEDASPGVYPLRLEGVLASGPEGDKAEQVQGINGLVIVE